MQEELDKVTVAQLPDQPEEHPHHRRQRRQG